jgi:hypothetical protein
MTLMRVVVLYRPKSEHYGRVMDYVHDYKRLHPQTSLELVSLDTKDGAETAKLYDVYAYPAILIISNDGHLEQLWQNEQLPLMAEIDAYVLS